MNIELHQLQTVREALAWALQMLEHRDTMNAAVHCAPLRLSPVTERVKAACALLDELRYRAP